MEKVKAASSPGGAPFTVTLTHLDDYYEHHLRTQGSTGREGPTRRQAAELGGESGRR